MKSGKSTFNYNIDDSINTKSRNRNGSAMKSNTKKLNSTLSGDNAKQNESKIIQLKDHNNDHRKEETSNREKKSNGFLSKLDYNDRIFITVNSTSRFIKVCDIQCITAEKDYTYICTKDEKRFLVLRPMIEWETRLPNKYFVRIHRSTIVNLDHVEKVEKWFNYSYHVFLKNREEPFQMSRRYATKLKERFR
ncbi:MAG TPA: LytTR family DNA-binding domain-containing protein [Ignavibacteriaceae bacterium]|nr:LytTR family DNA-binding domain-containing protein [Ignavibacteriaceae bacterium]